MTTTDFSSLHTTVSKASLSQLKTWYKDVEELLYSERRKDAINAIALYRLLQYLRQMVILAEDIACCECTHNCSTPECPNGIT